MGLFSKKQKYADKIFYNAVIYTENPEYPYAEAVAVYDGKIMGIGNYEDLESLKGTDTELIDLEGKYMYPGFIDCHRSAVMSALEGIIEERDDDTDGDEDQTEDYIDSDENETDKKSENLIEEEMYKGFVSINENGIRIGEEDEDEEGEYETEEDTEGSIEESEECTEEDLQEMDAGYVAMEEAFNVHVNKLLERGFTTILNLRTQDQLENMFFDYLMGAYNEDETKLRVFGSLFVNIPVNPMAVSMLLMRRKTNLIETDDTMNAEHLYVEVNNANNHKPFAQSELDDMLIEAAERGFKIYVDAADYDDLKMAYNSLEYIRGKGNKNIFIIASDEELSNEDKAESIYWETAIKTWGVDPLSKDAIYGNNIHGMERRIEELTMVPASMLGMENEIGTIEAGKYADFAIYEENLLDMENSRKACNLQASMVVLKGKIVFDLQSEIDDEMLDMMMGMHM